MRRRPLGPPGRPRFPDATTTGPDPARLDPTPFVGNFVTSADGQVVEGVHVTGQITNRHEGVQIIHSVARGQGTFNCIEMQAGALSALVEHCELGPNGPLAAENVTGIGGVRNDYTARHNNIHHTRDGAFIGSGTFEYNFVHHIGAGRGLPAHHDGLQMTKGDLGPTIIRGNSFVVGVFSGMNAAVFIKADTAPIGAVLVEGNYLEGGGYTLYAAEGPTHGWPASLTVRDNWYGRGSMYAPRLLGPTATEAGSRWLDTGALL